METLPMLPKNVSPSVHAVSISSKNLDEIRCLKHIAKLFYSEAETSELSNVLKDLHSLGYIVKDDSPKTSARPKEWPLEGRIILQYPDLEVCS